ncbi:unnamed protein product [Phaeothamnion confervicola]
MTAGPPPPLSTPEVRISYFSQRGERLFPDADVISEVAESILGPAQCPSASRRSRRIDVHAAAERGDILSIKAFLSTGGDIDLRDGTVGMTPLMWACKGGQTETAAFLLDNGADIEAGDSQLRTPLQKAASKGQAEVAALLIATGADIDGRDGTWRTPLHRASRWGFVDVIRLLLEKGASIEARDKTFSRTPLHYSCRASTGATRALLEAGADVHSQTAVRNTCLHLACDRGLVEIVRLLLDWGADPTERNDQGLMPAEVIGAWVNESEERGILRMLATLPRPERHPLASDAAWQHSEPSAAGSDAEADADAAAAAVNVPGAAAAAAPGADAGAGTAVAAAKRPATLAAVAAPAMPDVPDGAGFVTLEARRRKNAELLLAGRIDPMTLHIESSGRGGLLLGSRAPSSCSSHPADAGDLNFRGGNGSCVGLLEERSRSGSLAAAAAAAVVAAAAAASGGDGRCHYGGGGVDTGSGAWAASDSAAAASGSVAASSPISAGGTAAANGSKGRKAAGRHGRKPAAAKGGGCCTVS